MCRALSHSFPFRLEKRRKRVTRPPTASHNNPFSGVVRGRKTGHRILSALEGTCRNRVRY